MRFNKIISTCFVSMVIFSNAAMAQVSGIMTGDASNFAQNVEIIRQTASTYMEHVKQALNDIKHYTEMANQVKALSKGDLSALSKLLGDSTIENAYKDYKGLYKALSTLNGDIYNIDARVKYASQVASKYGKTYDQYMKERAAAAAANDKEAQAQRDADMEAAEIVKVSYQDVVVYEKNLPDTGIPLQQILSKQMNHLLKLQTKHLEYWIKASNEANSKKRKDQIKEDDEEDKKIKTGKDIEEKNKKHQEEIDKYLSRQTL